MSSLAKFGSHICHISIFNGVFNRLDNEGQNKTQNISQWDKIGHLTLRVFSGNSPIFQEAL